jgi:hypothetical protein
MLEVTQGASKWQSKGWKPAGLTLKSMLCGDSWRETISV